MVCLICFNEIAEELRYTDILCLKNKSFSTCSDCQNSFEKISEMHCPLCYKHGQDNICDDCQLWQNKNESINHTSLYRYNTAMKEYFSSYKFQGDYLLRYVFAKEIRQKLKEYKGYIIVPIPISDKRMEERGFNQVTGLLDAAGINYNDLLLKKESQKQSEKTREERLETKNDFMLKNEKELGESVLIVDDIYTTGATIQNAKRCFTEKNVKNIKTFSLAR